MKSIRPGHSTWKCETFWVRLLEGTFFLLSFISYLLTPQILAQVISEDRSIFREEEFFRVEQLVAIGSRRLQHLSESPSAVSVITADDIRQSGATNVIDLFRMIPGMDVITLDGPRSVVSARGFASETARTMLVMIDRRIIFLHQQGGTFWRTFPLSLEDIERIEILRGPGSTLYGINAFTGVINIITKDPEKYKGWTLSSTLGGNEELGLATLIYDQVYNDKFSYRLSTSYEQDTGFDKSLQGTPLEDAKRIPKATFRAKYHLSEDSDFHLSTGYLTGDRSGSFPVPANPAGEPGHEEFESFFLQSWYENRFSPTSTLFVQGYWNVTNAKFIFLNPVSGIREFDMDTLGAEFQYNFSFLPQHQLVFGGDYILDFLDAPQGNIHSRQDSALGFYIQDEYKPSDQLTLVAGIRVQDNTLSGTDVAPRGTLLYTPWKNHTFRFAMGQAILPPSQFEVFNETRVTLPTGAIVARLSNPNLDSAINTAYEIGYRTYLWDKLRLNVELYYNDIDKFPRSAPAPPPPGVTRATFISDGFNGFSKGVELEVMTPLTDWLQGRANYTYEFIDISDEGALRPGDLDKSTPRHKVNLGLRAKFPNGFSTNLQLSYVDHTAPLSDPTISLPPYTRLDVRVAKTFLNDTLEVAVTGQNLVDPHAESEVAVLDRLVFASMTWRF
ncbi:MAG TPA: TonB-dependent receptor [Candidatus Limnocylindrales bacterium]|nr:TonB-dependent receptor [Candidatus Limnocylindrales bacterium]